MTFLYAGKADNNDELYRLQDVAYYFQYEDPNEVAAAWCHNTPQKYLDEGHINEADLCEILKNSLDFDAAVELEETLEKYVLNRPLDPEPTHADRPGANRPKRKSYGPQPYFKAFPSEGQTPDSPDCPYYLVYPSAPNTPVGPAYYWEPLEEEEEEPRQYEWGRGSNW